MAFSTTPKQIRNGIFCVYFKFDLKTQVLTWKLRHLQIPAQHQSWAWALEKSCMRPSFFCIFKKSGKNEATDLAVSQLNLLLKGSTIAIISADVPRPGPKFKFSKTVVKIYNSVSTKRHWHNPRKQKLWRALQYKKCVCQCTDGLSATQNGLGTAEDFSTLQESNQCLPILCDLLTHWFMSITRKKLLGIWLVVFHQFFCVQDCSTQIFQVEYQGQTQNTRILEH